MNGAGELAFELSRLFQSVKMDDSMVEITKPGFDYDFCCRKFESVDVRLFE